MSQVFRDLRIAVHPNKVGIVEGTAGSEDSLRRIKALSFLGCTISTFARLEFDQDQVLTYQAKGRSLSAHFVHFLFLAFSSSSAAQSPSALVASRCPYFSFALRLANEKPATTRLHPAVAGCTIGSPRPLSAHFLSYSGARFLASTWSGLCPFPGTA
jgi:hypothetical protein